MARENPNVIFVSTLSLFLRLFIVTNSFLLLLSISQSLCDDLVLQRVKALIIETMHSSFALLPLYRVC